MSNVFFTEKGEKFLKILWIKKMLLILRGKSGSIVRFSCRLWVRLMPSILATAFGRFFYIS